MEIKVVIANMKILAKEANAAAWQKDMKKANAKLKEAKLLIEKYLDEEKIKAAKQKGAK